MTDKRQLIYKEDLLETVLNRFGCDLVYYGKDLQFCQEAIEMASAVDAAEVVHGYTLPAEEPQKVFLDSKCGICGQLMLSTDAFCSMCGAKMDGGSVDES